MFKVMQVLTLATGLLLSTGAAYSQPVPRFFYTVAPFNPGPVCSSRLVPFQRRVSLYMAKLGPTETNCAGGADITGVQGITLNTLSFDFSNNSWCGNGAPRFDVIGSDGNIYFFGCNAPGVEKIASSPGWTTAFFTASDAFDQFGIQTGIPAGVTVDLMDISFDEGTTQNGQPLGPGFAYVSRLTINGRPVNPRHVPFHSPITPHQHLPFGI